jgi:hypothetical protein
MHFAGVRLIFIGAWMAACVLLAFAVQDFSASDDRARKVVNQACEALGGSSALDSVKSLSARGIIGGTSLDKFPVVFKLDMLFPDKLRRILKWKSSPGMVENIETVNNGSIWTDIKIGKKLGDIISFGTSVNAMSGRGASFPGGMGGGLPGGMGGPPPGGMGGGAPGGMSGGPKGGMGGGAPGGMSGGPKGGMDGGPPGGIGGSGLDGNLSMLLSKMIEGILRGGTRGRVGKIESGLPPGGGRGSSDNRQTINGISPNILIDRNNQQIACDFFCLLIAFLPHVRDSSLIETNNDARFNAKMDVNAYFLKYSSSGGLAAILAIDKKTHLPIAASYFLNGAAESTNPDSAAVQIYFSEYRKVSIKKGVSMLLPHQITKTQNGKIMEQMDINKYHLNSGVKPEQFEKK